MRKLQVIAAVSLVALQLGGCSDSNDGTPGSTSPTAFNASPILNDYGNNVVLQIYSDLADEAGDLEAAVTTLQGNTNVANLEAAQAAWVSTRIPWENSEAFLFGPVDTGGFDPRLDSWPVNRVDLDAVLAGTDTLNEAFIANQPDDRRGFHTIEYLLFDDGSGDRSSAAIVAAFGADARRMEYLVALTANLTSASQELRDAWSPTSGNFVSNITGAGDTSTLYPSQKSALEEAIDGMIVIADEVGNGKIADPFGSDAASADTTLVESQFSFNSIADFQNNIRGIQSVYTGDYDGDVNTGIDAYVATQDAALNTRFLTEIQAAIDAIGAISNPFRDAITTDRASVQAAIDAVNTVQATLENDIKPLVLAGTFSS